MGIKGEYGTKGNNHSYSFFKSYIIFEELLLCLILRHFLNFRVFYKTNPYFQVKTKTNPFFCPYYSSIKFPYYPYVFELFTKLPFLFIFLLISKLTKNQIHPNHFFLFTKIPSSSIFSTTMNHHF